MWDSLKTATAPSALQLPPAHNIKRPFRSQTLPLQPNGDQKVWQNDFDRRLHGLGISNGPFKYEVRRGKIVPASGQVSPPADFDDSAAPPVRDPPPRNPRRPRRSSDRRPTSPIYNEASLTTSRFKTVKDMYGRPTAALEISPPSSPELDATRRLTYHEDVSPIDESPDVSQQDLLRDDRQYSTPTPTQESQSRSHLPMIRHEKRRNQDAASSTLRESRSKDKLHDQQNHPVQHPWEHVPTRAQVPEHVQQTFGVTTTVTAPQVRRTNNAPPSFGQRMRQFTRGKPESIENRPPWNGASGRMSLIDPVRDDLAVEPLRLPRRSSKRVGRNAGVSPVNSAGSETSSGAVATVRRLLPSRSNQKLKEAAKSPSYTDLTQAATAGSYPSPPYLESPISQSHAATQPVRPSQGLSLLSPNITPDQNKAIRRKPPPSPQANFNTHHPHISTSSSVYSTQPDLSNSINGPRLSTTPPSTSPFTPQDPWVQPPSRFSVTTCNTTVPGSRDSDEEDRPPMPAPPQLPSMMDRRRPIPGGDSSRSASAEPIVVSMNSSYVSSHGGLDQGKSGAGRSGEERPVSIVSTSKALPPAPPELQSANDRVANLNARLENLAHRRGNINKSIKQMTELMPNDNLMASSDVLRKREIEKQKVEGLKEELAEIQREEYDLGLKLHRAYKRLDRDASYEPTTLWVRRVTH
ncbi:Fc.00g064310.m01.CDS01 [Cosmosporella sp. VM-42]